MPDYSLVPVDYQPDFSDFSLVPVDYDPFGADGVTQQAAAPGESYDPDSGAASGVPASGQPYNPSAAPISAPGKPVLANQQPPGDMSAPVPTSGGNEPSFGKSLLQGTINAVVPGAYHSGLAQQQFRQGNYGAAALYGAESLADAALGAFTLGASTRFAAAARAAKTMPAAADEAGAGLRAAVMGTEVQFAQKGVKPTFSEKGFFAGRSIDDVAAALRNGTMSSDQLPLNVITRDGVTYTLNNRSLMALRRGGQQPTILNDMTGHPEWESRLTQRLKQIDSNAGPGFVPSVRKQ